MESAKSVLYMVGNAHIDPVWLWQWPEGYQEVLATFRSALDRLAEDPDFVFTASSAAFYKWVEETDPAMFREIQQRVAEGRWQLAGGWWVEPDCNIPCGESFVRQGLYGQRYFHAKFGVIARVGYNPDSFGHSGMLPQILRKSGLAGYVYLRPSHHEQSLPGDTFWWESDDGSRVLAYRIPYEYCSWPEDIERQVRRVAATLKPPLDRGLCFYGVGDHGGGPTRANLACLRGLAHDPTLPRLEFAGPAALLDWLDATQGEIHSQRRSAWPAPPGAREGSGTALRVQTACGQEDRPKQSLGSQDGTMPYDAKSPRPDRRSRDGRGGRAAGSWITDHASRKVPPARPAEPPSPGPGTGRGGRAPSGMTHDANSRPVGLRITDDGSLLTPDAFLPTHHADLQHHASGCYAAHSGVKRWNRQAEQALLAAEKWAAVGSWVTGSAYPAAELRQAWQDVLFNQFHDILAGSSIEAAYADAQQSFGAALAAAGRALNAGLQGLAWRIRLPVAEALRPLVVFNPHAWPSRVPVETEFGRLAPEDGLTDEAGQPVPVQRGQSEASTRNRHRLRFVADLPPLGYRVYYMGPAPASPEAARQPQAEAGTETTVLENRRLRLALDPLTGCIASLYDKAHGTEVFLGQAARPVVIDDPSDTWGHNVYRFDREAGTFAPTQIRLIEHGPVRSVLRVESAYQSSTLVQDFTLYAELELVDVDVTVDWHEGHRALKLRFPANIAFQKVTAEIPYGHIERFANGDEQPGQSWVDVSGESRDTGGLYGVSILNDGKYSFDVQLRDIGLTVLRSPIYAHHIPYRPEPGGSYRYMDQGVQRFRYRILPHAGSWEDAGTVRRAAELNQRAAVLPTTFHPQGSLPPSASFLSIDRDNIVVTVLKQAEDGPEALVLRAYEAHRAAAHARICLPHWNRVIEADFGPCEIKTFRIPRDRSLPVEETDLLEWAA